MPFFDSVALKLFRTGSNYMLLSLSERVSKRYDRVLPAHRSQGLDRGDVDVAPCAMVEMGQQITTQRDHLLVALSCQLLEERGALTGRALGEHTREHLIRSLIAHSDHRTKRFALQPAARHR